MTIAMINCGKPQYFSEFYLLIPLILEPADAPADIFWIVTNQLKCNWNW